MPSLEDDYLDRARELWQRYQFYVYTLLGMILAAITGFTLSHTSHEENQRAANAQLYQLMESVDHGRREEAQAAYEVLRQDGEFPELGYLAAFALASLHFSDGDYNQAADILAPGLEGSADSGVRHLAALRIAEARIAAGDPAQAVAVLEDSKPEEGRLRIMFEERIGDAEYTAGRHAEALRAYQRALALALQAAPFYQPVLRVKIGALQSDPDAAAAMRAMRDEDANAADSGS